jgi:2-dehydropantoate 2-reductase
MKDLDVMVAGAGAVGQWLGGRLEQAGYEVTLWTTQRHVDALATGLVIHGATTMSGHVRAVSTMPKGPFDLVFLTSKAYRTAALAEKAATALSPEGVFVTLQNGLGNAQKVARFVPPDRVAVALTSNGVTLEHPGRLHHTGAGPTVVGPMEGAKPEAARRAHDVFQRLHLDPEWQPRMRGFVWHKAVINAGVNPVGALNGVTNGRLADDPALRGQALAALAEGVAVAQKAGVALPAGDPGAALLATLEKTRPNKVSMLQDVEARRPTETEQILGRLSRLAARLGVRAPTIDTFYGRMKDLEASYLGKAAASKLAAEEKAWETEIP